MPTATDSGVIVTYTGGTIEPLNPDPADINIEDIAHALSQQCRFTGHVRKFYSVAEHSVRVAEWLAAGGLSTWTVFTGLLHDASEAYLSDIARPVKQQPEIRQFYEAAEERLMLAIAKKFGFNWPAGPIIKVADNVLLRSEQRDLMPDRLRFPGDEYLDETIKPWSPEDAESDFLWMFYALSDELGREASG